MRSKCHIFSENFTSLAALARSSGSMELPIGGSGGLLSVLRQLALSKCFFVIVLQLFCCVTLSIIGLLDSETITSISFISLHSAQYWTLNRPSGHSYKMVATSLKITPLQTTFKTVQEVQICHPQICHLGIMIILRWRQMRFNRCRKTPSQSFLYLTKSRNS